MPNPDENNRADYSFKPGDIVGGNYRIINFIGKGAMGKVYRAQHEMMPREYALKTLNENQVTEESWRRFQVEAQSIARMSHPNVVVIYNLGIHNGFLPYYVMDLLNGESLFDRLNRVEVLSVQDAIPIFTQVCDGLGYAHKKGIVHRDIKPDNIFLLKEPEPGGISVKIVDFGIAKLSDAKDPKNQQLTKVGEVFGTPFYMSPEQCMGLRVDGRSDIYSLGCALFETLTGTPPFRGINSMETMMMHQNDAPPSLEKASHGSKFPESIEILIAKTLAKEPMDRYQSMEQLKLDLNKILEGKDLSVLPYLNLNENRQAGVNETLRLTGKSENITGRQGHSKDRETMFVDPTGPQDKLRSTASGAYIDRGESASTARITRPYGDDHDLDQADSGSQPQTHKAKSLISAGKIGLILAGISLIAGAGFLAAHFFVKPPTKTNKVPDAALLNSSPLLTLMNFDGNEDLPKTAPPSIKDAAPYSSIVSLGGRKYRRFDFPPDISLGSIAYFSQKGLMGETLRAQGRRQVDVNQPLIYLPNNAIVLFPEYLKRFRAGDVQGVSLRVNGSDKLLQASVKFPGLKELRLVDLHNINPETLNSLAQAKTLECLWLNNSSFKGDQLQVLRELPNLKVVAFKGGINPTGLLKNLQQSKTIEVLDLEGCKLSHEDYILLSKLRTLQHINIAGSAPSSSDLELIAKNLPLRQLDIRLSNPPKNLAKIIKQIRTLKCINTGDTPLEIDLCNQLRATAPDIKIGTTIPQKDPMLKEASQDLVKILGD